MIERRTELGTMREVGESHMGARPNEEMSYGGQKSSDLGDLARPEGRSY